MNYKLYDHLAPLLKIEDLIYVMLIFKLMKYIFETSLGINIHINKGKDMILKL